MNIKLVDVPRQNKLLRRKLHNELDQLIDSGDFIIGESLTRFEKNFASFCNKKYAVGVNSGTDGLKLALIAYGIKPGDEVITAPNSYFSTAMIISDLGANPVFVDINPYTHTLATDKLESVITKKTKAIIPVHLYGQPADMDPILEISKKHNLFIIEDACQAHGAMYKNKIIPFTETGVFSFYPGKNLGSLGDGGIIVTDNATVADRLIYLRNDGAKKKYYHKMIGMKSRLHTLQAAFLNVKLPYLHKWNKQRRMLAKLYSSYLKNIPGIITPFEAADRMHVYHLYVIETNQRNALQKYLSDIGIETVIHYPVPIHLQKAYKSQGYYAGQFPVTEKKAGSILSLPLFPEMKSSEVQFICNQIKIFMSKKQRKK